MGREELHSPEIQEAAIRRSCEINNIDLIGMVYDLDKSGRDFAHRKIMKMIEEVRAGEYEVVPLWKWSRFGRNLRHSLNNLHDLEMAGGDAISATEPGDSKTIMGRFSRNQMLMIAELQSDQISESWKDTHALRLRMGLPHNGVPRFGYIRQGREFVPAPIISDAFIEVYERFVSGEPMRSVSLDMKDLGIRAPNGDVLTNSRWIYLMETGFAAGLLRRRKDGATSKRFDQWEWFPGAHQPIISMDLWEAFKRKRLASLGRNWVTPKAKYSVSGLLTCGRCTIRTLTATGSPKNRTDVMFRCGGIITKECKGVHAILRLAENRVLQWLQDRAHMIGDVDQKARQIAAQRKQTNEAEQLKAALAKAKDRLSRVLDMYEDGALSKAEYTKRREAREAEIRELDQQISAVQDHQIREIPPKFYEDLIQAWGVLSHDDKRQALKQVIKTIIVHPQGVRPDRFEIIPHEGI